MRSRESVTERWGRYVVVGRTKTYGYVYRGWGGGVNHHTCLRRKKSAAMIRMRPE